MSVKAGLVSVMCVTLILGQEVGCAVWKRVVKDLRAGVRHHRRGVPREVLMVKNLRAEVLRGVPLQASTPKLKPV